MMLHKGMGVHRNTSQEQNIIVNSQERRWNVPSITARSTSTLMIPGTQEILAHYEEYTFKPLTFSQLR